MRYLGLILLMTLILGNTGRAQFNVDIELGRIFSGYNDVRIPGDQGTLFSLSEELEADPAFFGRLRLNYNLSERNTLALLYAPLSINSSGQFEKDVIFQGQTFTANTAVDGLYRFNSYRLTWRYVIYRTPTIDLGLGLTAKIRDAEIRLQNAQFEAKKTNVGFVPIINFLFAWKLQQRWQVLLEGDALAAPQGRAEDIFVGLNYKVSDKFRIKAGYRILEGGADNDEVYNFALIHYAVLGFFIEI